MLTKPRTPGFMAIDKKAELCLYLNPDTMPHITADLETLLRCALNSNEYAALPPEQRANLFNSALLANKAVVVIAASLHP